MSASQQTLYDMAADSDQQPGYTLATILMVWAERPDEALPVPVSHWFAGTDTTDLADAWNYLCAWDLPPVDEPDDDDWQPPKTDDDFIAYAVAEAEQATAMANAIARMVDPHLDHVDEEPVNAAAEAVLEFERWRAARLQACSLVRAEIKQRVTS